MTCAVALFALIATTTVSAASIGSWSHQPNRSCKPIPGSTDWPSPSDWAALNTSTSGRLFSPQPLGAVCHPDRPEYNNQSCAIVAAQWTNTSFQAADLLSADYNDVTCLPQADAPCSGSGYPDYVIDAQGVADVQAGVNFARRTGVRLVIKGTGHNFPGRSSGSYSLSIYTRNLKGFELNRNDPAATALGGIASVKISAGSQVREIETFAADNNITVVAGSDPNVGIGGWISAGGHSPLSSKYGLGVDQILSMEVVTADGVQRQIDADHEADLFWALRGGGSGTFAVLISVTVRAFPNLAVSSYSFTYNTAGDSDTFWSMITYWHTQIPRISEAGLMGYYYFVANNPASNHSIAGTFWGILLGPELSIDRLKAIIAPVDNTIMTSSWGDPIYNMTYPGFYPNFMSAWAQNAPLPAGAPGRLGSRLLGNETLLGDQDALKGALQTSSGGIEFIGHMVAGPGARNPPGGIAGGNNSLLPAWREAYVHAALPRSWPALNQTALTEVTTNLRDIEVQALVNVAPDSGAYTNEADPTTQDWQKTFFGANYPRLSEIKRRWDPEGVFWCKSCVGSELWEPVGSDGIENGVAQNLAQLCRANDYQAWNGPAGNPWQQPCES